MDTTEFARRCHRDVVLHRVGVGISPGSHRLIVGAAGCRQGVGVRFGRVVDTAVGSL